MTYPLSRYESQANLLEEVETDAENRSASIWGGLNIPFPFHPHLASCAPTAVSGPPRIPKATGRRCAVARPPGAWRACRSSKTVSAPCSRRRPKRCCSSTARSVCAGPWPWRMVRLDGELARGTCRVRTWKGGTWWNSEGGETVPMIIPKV